MVENVCSLKVVISGSYDGLYELSALQKHVPRRAH